MDIDQLFRAIVNSIQAKKFQIKEHTRLLELLIVAIRRHQFQDVANITHKIADLQKMETEGNAQLDLLIKELHARVAIRKQQREADQQQDLENEDDLKGRYYSDDDPDEDQKDQEG